MLRPLAGVLVLVAFAATVLHAADAPADEPRDQGTMLARPDLFRALVDPDCSHCVDEAKRRAGDLRPDDRVLAWTRGRYDGGAVPLRFFLAPHRVISDTYGVFVYDPDAGFMRGFGPSLDFTFHGWRNGVMTIRHNDGTLFSALSGVAFDGPRKGERLKPVPTIQSDWGHWLKHYPGTVAYNMFEKYQPVELPTKATDESVGTRGSPDPRLPADAAVIGLYEQGRARAYEVAASGRTAVVHDRLGEQDVVVLWHGPTRAGAAYAPEVEGADPTGRVKLRVDEGNPAAPFVDAESGSHFGVEGRAVDGPLKGKTLRWLDSVQCKWFAWAAEYPKTDIQKADNARAAADRPGGRREAVSGVIVEPTRVTPEQIGEWKRGGVNAVAVVLDERHPPEAYRASAKAASDGSVDLYYWVEVARNPAMADEHPRWMASLGMHDDWHQRFPDAPKPGKGEVAKAYPWVPITSREAYDAHLTRVGELVGRRAAGRKAGVLLNDLQGGPSSCGCGNGQCRWATDYGVSATATKLDGDDIAARFTSAVRKLVPGNTVVPIWTTECEDIDLPQKLAPGGKSTGLCGGIECANTTCPKAFTKQWPALLKGGDGPVGVLALHEELGHDRHGFQVPSRISKRCRPSTAARPCRTSGCGSWSGDEAAEGLRTGAVFRALVPLKQSFEPRVVRAAD